MKRKLIITVLVLLAVGVLCAATITDTVINVTANVLKLDPDKISTSDNFKFDLGASSAEIDSILGKLEEIYDVNIPDEDAEGLTTVGKVSSYLANK